jgi:V8-like Glu-specific endopeptidase
MLFKFSIHALALVVSQGAFALNTGFDFEGIVALNNCSGSLVRLENSKPTDKALVLTNGHCVSSRLIKAGEVIYKKPVNRSMNLLNSQGVEVGRLVAEELVYATMTRTDMALYRTRETYADIEASMKVRPFVLQSVRASLKQPIQVISGYWKRGYACSIEAFVHELRQDEWTMYESIRYSRPGCETIGGTSGSPIIATGTRTVIGVNNTGNENGERCTLNNPCEIDENGNVSYQQGYSYGQQTYLIYGCLAASGEIDINVPGCRLPR